MMKYEQTSDNHEKEDIDRIYSSLRKELKIEETQICKYGDGNQRHVSVIGKRKGIKYNRVTSLKH